jgi:hypothetical protein
MLSTWPRVQWGVLLILLGSYAYFWHSRDWNTASRLILTYAVVDRGTISLTGLHHQTGDIAYFRGDYLCDKLPGFSLLATIPYSLARLFMRLPAHPLNGPALAYWTADYWVTLGTSGLFSALTAVLLVRFAREMGCLPGIGALVGLSYGLATPAYVYATLAYGHQVSAFCLFSAFFLLWKPGESQIATRMGLAAAGILAAYAAVIELQVGPVSAILGLYLVVLCLLGKRRLDSLAYFGIGAMLPSLLLLTYNFLAFGSPLEMGYFHHATSIFAQVHNKQNPLGLQPPNWQLLRPLLVTRFRGLFFYAPILVLAPPGWIHLARARRWDLFIVSVTVCLAVLLVNLSYPEWTGGWSTGPRLLVPLLPFAFIPIAALLSGTGTRAIALTWIAAILSLLGGFLTLLFQGVGGRIPQYVSDPLTEVVIPLWKGAPLPAWWTGDRFACNLTELRLHDQLASLPVRWQSIQFVPILAAQVAAIWILLRISRDRSEKRERERPQ